MPIKRSLESLNTIHRKERVVVFPVALHHTHKVWSRIIFSSASHYCVTENLATPFSQMTEQTETAFRHLANRQNLMARLRSTANECTGSCARMRCCLSVKTMKRDYISIIPKPDGLTATKNFAEVDNAR